MDRSPWTAPAAERDDPALLPGGPARRGATVILLVSVGILASALSGPWRPTLRSQDGSAVPEPTPVEATPQPGPTPDPFVEALEDMDIQPWNLTWLWVGLAVLVATGLLYLAVGWLRRRPRRRPEGTPDPGDLLPGEAIAGEPGLLPDLPALREGLDDAGDELRRHRRPADAVIAAWVALEVGAERSGVVRHPAATPTEFTVAVLDRTRADRAATRVLLELYLRARFGSDPMAADDVVAATEAVRVLTADLAAQDDQPEVSDGDDSPDGPEPGAGPGDPR
ncbi:MAG: hypothetical protein JWP95_556 [Actinotalea sp.]|nr:hypothetical protein [Actinotalea sp.]